MYIIIFHIVSSDRLNMFAFILHYANRQLVKLHDHWVSSNTSCQYIMSPITSLFPSLQY